MNANPNDPMGKKVVLYARVSTAGQTCENQLLQLRTFAASRGFQVVEEVTDTGFSGKKTARPGLNRVMDLARKRLISGVLVFKFDRFGRNLKHLVESLQEFQRLRIDFISFSENIDTGSAWGTCIFAILGALAEVELSLVRERVAAGLARARAEGKRLGRPPVAVSPERVAEEYGRLHSIRQVARSLRLSPATTQRLLKEAQRKLGQVPALVAV
jgi:DNA invertase Pin-like site-specific DNA recombinase